MTNETSTMQLIPFTFSRTAGHQYDEFVEKIAEMLRAAGHISSISFDETYLSKWYGQMSYEDAAEFPELVELTFRIHPGIFIDHTRTSKIEGEQKELLETIQKISQWLKKHSCPKLRTVNILWAESSYISWKFYTGSYDGYDEYGPIRETDYDYAEEPLDCNLVVFYFMDQFQLDFSWLPETVTKLTVPGILFDRSTGRPDMEIVYDPSEPEEVDEEAFDAILEKYMNLCTYGLD